MYNRIMFKILQVFYLAQWLSSEKTALVLDIRYPSKLLQKSHRTPIYFKIEQYRHRQEVHGPHHLPDNNEHNIMES